MTKDGATKRVPDTEYYEDDRDNDRIEDPVPDAEEGDEEGGPAKRGRIDEALQDVDTEEVEKNEREGRGQEMDLQQPGYEIAVDVNPLLENLSEGGRGRLDRGENDMMLHAGEMDVVEAESEEGSGSRNTRASEGNAQL